MAGKGPLMPVESHYSRKLETRPALFTSGKTLTQPAQRPGHRTLSVPLSFRRNLCECRQRNRMAFSGNRQSLYPADVQFLLQATFFEGLRQESAAQKHKLLRDRPPYFFPNTARIFVAICTPILQSLSSLYA